MAERDGSKADRPDPRDAEKLLCAAVKVVVSSQFASTSMLQRKLGLGFAVAGNLMDKLEGLGIVTAPQGSRPRDVLVGRDDLATFMPEMRARIARVASSEGEESPGSYLLEKLRHDLAVPIPKSGAFVIVGAVAQVISELWLERGGRELPRRLERLLEQVSSILATYVDLSAGEWGGMDAFGRPDRPVDSDVREQLIRAGRSRIQEGVRGRLSYDTAGWDDISSAFVLDRVVEIAARQIRDADAVEAASAEARFSLQRWQLQHPAPITQPYGLSPEGAERWICDWMVHMGAADAVVTRASGDGGVDVLARGWAAQVKLYRSPVAIAEIRELVGAAAALPESPGLLFFCSGGFSAQAPLFTDATGMALFKFSVETGAVTPESSFASLVLESGLFPPDTRF